MTSPDSSGITVSARSYTTHWDTIRPRTETAFQIIIFQIIIQIANGDAGHGSLPVRRRAWHAQQSSDV